MIQFTVNQFRPGTKDTGGSHTTIVYDGIKIRGFGGSGRADYLLDRYMLAHIPSLRGPRSAGGSFAGDADGGAAGSPGGMYRRGGIASGAVGRGGDGRDEYNPPEIPADVPGECSRIAAANVSGLFEALAVVGIDTTEICANRAAFGSSGVGYDDGDHAFEVVHSPGIGGGGVGVTDWGPHLVTGQGAVVLQFSSALVSNPKREFTPMAVVLTEGAQAGVLADIDGHFSGNISSFQTYAVPTGATNVKAWAIGSGGQYGAGSVAYAEWMVYSGQLIYYRIGAVGGQWRTGNPSYVIAGPDWPLTWNNSNPYFIKRLVIAGGGGLVMNVNGAGSFRTYSGGDGGIGGGSNLDEDFSAYAWGQYGGAIGGNGELSAEGRIRPRSSPIIDELFEVVTMAGGYPNFGEGGNIAAPNPNPSPGNTTIVLTAGIGGGGRPGDVFGPGQGAVVFKFT